MKEDACWTWLYGSDFDCYVTYDEFWWQLHSNAIGSTIKKNYSLNSDFLVEDNHVKKFPFQHNWKFKVHYVLISGIKHAA